MSGERLQYTEEDHFGLQFPVYILDDIRVRPGKQAEFMKLMDEHYLPLANERKMELANVLCFPPFTIDDRPADLVYLWRVASLEAWWDMRIAEETDERLPAFWAGAADLVLERTRRLGRPPELMTGTEPDRADLRKMSQPLGTRHIAMIRPVDALSPADEAQWTQAASSLTDRDGVLVSRAGFHVEFSFLENHLTWDVVTAPGQAVDANALLAQLPGPAEMVEWVTLEPPVDLGIREPIGAVSRKRTIFLRAGDEVVGDHRDEFEAVLAMWVRQLEGIRAWSLSRIAQSTGTVRWTHCFEQEFDDPSVITKDYLEHPFHWAIADRYFGPEGHEKAVYEFVHTIRNTDQTMLGCLPGSKAEAEQG